MPPMIPIAKGAAMIAARATTGGETHGVPAGKGEQG
jgi:hypothetical protein